MKYYFAYVSNMGPGRMKKRGVNFSSRVAATFKGYRLEFSKVENRNSAEGYANIVPDENGVIEGVLYEIADDGIKKTRSMRGFSKALLQDRCGGAS